MERGTAVPVAAQQVGSGAQDPSGRDLRTRLWQSLQTLLPHPAWWTQGKLVSGYRGDQLTPPRLKINYAWLNNRKSKCNSLKSGSASLFRAQPRALAQGRGLSEHRAALCSRQAPGLAASRGPHLLRPFGRSHSDSISPVVDFRNLGLFSCFPTFLSLSIVLEKHSSSAFFPDSKRRPSESMALPFNPPVLS